ncbi:MAG: OmpA family protein [Paracoccaceae bacterium]
MSRSIYAIGLATALTLGVAWQPVLAQSSNSEEMTAEEITEAFKKQKTRGLVIVPSAGAAASTAATDDTTEVATVSAEYNEVASEDQVNIQISFDFDSAALRPDQKAKLSTMCEVMKSIDVSLFQIIGHTDSSGKASYNERLSLLRAQEVKRHLVKDCGIADDRLEALGLGESAPLNKNDPRADENRRVEFQALG